VEQRHGEKQQRPHESSKRHIEIIRGAGEIRRGAVRRSKEKLFVI
jgi:hypothetical protein